VIICHAAIDPAGRYLLPEFSNGGYQVVWCYMVGLYVVIAIIVVLVADPKGWSQGSLVAALRIRRTQLVFAVPWAGIVLVRASRMTLSPNSNSSPKS
jgi:hypothetical protein